MITTITAILIFLFVILFHEFGHFIVAKAVGVRVNEFSIGMGPKLIQTKQGETDYTLRALPIGGYVAMEGEEDTSDDPRSFHQAAVWKRFLIIVAGAFMNFVLAFLVLLLVFGLRGEQTTTIESFSENSALQEAGFLPGDTITNIDGVAITDWTTLTETVDGLTPNTPVIIQATRGGETIEEEVTPYFDEQEQRVLIGVLPTMERNLGSVVSNAASYFGVIMGAMFQFLKSLVGGGVGIGELSGPVGIISTINQASQMGLFSVLMLLAFISINVGVFNLLPIPALDGGKILFLLVEAVRGKPIPPEKENVIHLIGFMLLMGLILVVTFQDVMRLQIFGG